MRSERCLEHLCVAYGPTWSPLNTSYLQEDSSEADDKLSAEQMSNCDCNALNLQGVCRGGSGTASAVLRRILCLQCIPRAVYPMM